MDEKEFKSNRQEKTYFAFPEDGSRARESFACSYKLRVCFLVSSFSQFFFANKPQVFVGGKKGARAFWPIIFQLFKLMANP